jgi:hypothetical protein
MLSMQEFKDNFLLAVIMKITGLLSLTIQFASNNECTAAWRMKNRDMDWAISVHPLWDAGWPNHRHQEGRTIYLASNVTHFYKLLCQAVGMEEMKPCRRSCLSHGCFQHPFHSPRTPRVALQFKTEVAGDIWELEGRAG